MLQKTYNLDALPWRQINQRDIHIARLCSWVLAWRHRRFHKIRLLFNDAILRGYHRRCWWLGWRGVVTLVLLPKDVKISLVKLFSCVNPNIYNGFINVKKWSLNRMKAKGS